jgi:hypothetical protein
LAAPRQPNNRVAAEGAFVKELGWLAALACRIITDAPQQNAFPLGPEKKVMRDLIRARRALEQQHTRRALVLGLPLAIGAILIAASVGDAEYLLLRATLIWLVAMGFIAQWRMTPLLRARPRFRPPQTALISRLTTHPVGALIAGVVLVLPFSAIAAVITRDLGGSPTVSRAQLSLAVGVLLGGMTGIAFWERAVGVTLRRYSARSAHRDSVRRLTP